MLNILKQHLKRIQNSDEATKRRWLIGATAASMILIIGLWLIYINFIVESFTINVQEQELSVGSWQIFKHGLRMISKSIWNNIESSVSEITKERTIIIE